jgi:glycosyltransferase involved in cell wall biosynthesis
VADVVRALAGEVEWVFFGMCPEPIRALVREFHGPVAFEEYPARLAALDLDLALAPLEVNRFNECKSNLRLLEYGALGWPVVATDIEPYRGAPVTRVPNRAAAWIEAVRERIHDLDAAAREGDALREWVRAHWMLEDHLDDWLTALDPRCAPRQAGGRAAEA